MPKPKFAYDDDPLPKWTASYVGPLQEALKTQVQHPDFVTNLAAAFDSAGQLIKPLLPTVLGGGEQTPDQPIKTQQPKTPEKSEFEERGSHTVKKDLSKDIEMANQEQQGQQGQGGSRHSMQNIRTEPKTQTIPGFGGGGDGPDIDMTPVHTGTQKVFFQKTLVHYIKSPPSFIDVVTDRDTEIKQGWSPVPYNYFCSSMTPREWQWINTACKRWRVLSVGFKMDGFTPFINSVNSSGGAVAPKLEFNINPTYETYIDKAYQIPKCKYDALPNDMMQMSIGSQNDTVLPQITWSAKNFIPKWENDNYKNYYSSTHFRPFNLMQSREWEIHQPHDAFSFEHTFKPYEMIWRHGLFVYGASEVANNEWTAMYAGRVDGGFIEGQSDNADNYSMNHMLAKENERPTPPCLIRPSIIFNTQATVEPIVFKVFCKYGLWIELDFNEVLNAPIFLRNFQKDKPTNHYIDIYNAKAPATTVECDMQPSGANFIRRHFGPSDKLPI